jgi:hypothetical protein
MADVGIAPESGTAMMPVTHEPGFAYHCADRVLFFADGDSWSLLFHRTERSAPLVLIEAGNGVTGVGEARCRQPAIGSILAYLADVVAPQFLGPRSAIDEV